jgi:AraC-like DNA-binding protein
MQLLFLASEVLVVFILLIFLSKKNKQAYDILLIIWFLLVLINTQGFNLQSTSAYYYFIELSSAVVFLHGPVIWFYYYTLTTNKIQFRIHYLLHLLPFTINLLIILPSLFYQRLTNLSEAERNILMVAKLISIITYTLITIVHLNWHKKTIKDYFSNTNKKELQWLQLVLYGILFIWILAVLSQVAVHLTFQTITKANEDILVNIAVSVLVIIMGYYGFKQGSVFQSIPVQIVVREIEIEPTGKKEEQQTKTSPAKYKKSGLSREVVEKSAIALENYMKLRKPYLEPDLNLLQLAKAVNLSANDLSQVINEHFSVNFFDFINAYRVSAIKEAITNGETGTKTLLGIAFDAGFNSKASFNRAFKKITGQTPTEYMSALKNN